jgi:hypothetical protein
LTITVSSPQTSRGYTLDKSKIIARIVNEVENQVCYGQNFQPRSNEMRKIRRYGAIIHEGARHTMGVKLATSMAARLERFPTYVKERFIRNTLDRKTSPALSGYQVRYMTQHQIEFVKEHGHSTIGLNPFDTTRELADFILCCDIEFIEGKGWFVTVEGGRQENIYDYFYGKLPNVDKSFIIKAIQWALRKHLSDVKNTPKPINSTTKPTVTPTVTQKTILLDDTIPFTRSIDDIAILIQHSLNGFSINERGYPIDNGVTNHIRSLIDRLKNKITTPGLLDRPPDHNLMDFYLVVLPKVR